jgi:hypothetical protein
MLKFFFVTQIFNFCISLADFSSDFKHVILFYLDELLGLPYMIGKLKMFNFHYNLNHMKIPPINPNISQTVYKGLV